MKAAEVQLQVPAGLLAAETVGAVHTARWTYAWFGTTRRDVVA